MARQNSALHQRRERRFASAKARRALAWGAVVFLLFQLGLAFTLDNVLSEIGNPFFAAKETRLRRLLDEPAAPTRKLLLMLGSSRTVYGLDAARMETDLQRRTDQPICVFNFGVIGAGPVSELLHYQRLVKRGIQPNLMLVEVMPPFLAGQVDQPDEARVFPQSNRLTGRELDLLDRYRFPVADLRQTRRLSWIVPEYAHRDAIMSRLLPVWLPYRQRLNCAHLSDAHGWSSWTDALPPDQLATTIHAEHQCYSKLLENFQTTGTPVQALRDLLAEARRRQVPTALVLMPEGSEFRRWYPANAQAQLNALLDDLSRQYRVPIIDARRWAADGDFFDIHHLRAEGAARFSDRLGREVVERGLIHE